MYYVSLSLGAVFVLTGGKYYLIGMAVDSDGVVTITKGTDDLTGSIGDYAPFCLMTTEEIIAKFAITPTTPMLLQSLVLDVPATFTVYKDQVSVGFEATSTIDIVALTGGTFGVTVASSDENVVTVTEAAGVITYTPVDIGNAVVNVLVEDSEGKYRDAVFNIDVTVAVRELVFDQIGDININAGGAGEDFPLFTTGFDNAIDSVDVYSTDNEIMAVTYADDGTNASVGTITCTPHATQKGEVEVVVIGMDAASTVVQSKMTFKARVD